MDNHRSIILLAGTPSKLHALMAGLSEEQLRRRPSQGEWSIKEVLCHLRDTTEIHELRMRRVVTEENPLLPAFDQEAYARDRKYQEEQTSTILPSFLEHRRAMVELVRGLPQDAWDRRGIHEETGPLSLRDLVQGAVNHDLEHLAQLRRLRDGVLGQPYPRAAH